MQLLHLLRAKFIGFLKRPLFVKIWFLPTIVLLLLSKALIFLVSFRRLAPLLGEAQGVDPFLPLVPSRGLTRARQIGAVINLAAKWTPLGKDCFPKALTARMLLGLHRVPYAMFFGVCRGAEGIDAHAWVYSGGHCICGGRRSFWEYRVVTVFSTPGFIPR